MTTALPLGPGGEFDRIRAIAAALGSAATGLGGDCALIPAGTGTLALSTDTSVEGVHFRRDWLTAEEIGWRAAASALSDLAAGAASLVGLLAAVTVPPDGTEEELVAVMRGVGAAATASGGTVLGGDLSRGAAWSLTITVLGRAERPLSRAGAMAGDRLWVTGMLGASRAALEQWRRGDHPAEEARRAFALPLPRIAAGVTLARLGARAAIDLSDGLGGDARHLAAASGVAIAIELERLPVAPSALAEAGRSGTDGATFAAEGGEDYELLVALPPVYGERDAVELTHAAGVAVTPVGIVEKGEGVRFTLHGTALAIGGWNHFPLG